MIQMNIIHNREQKRKSVDNFANMEENIAIIEEHFTFMEERTKSHVRACVFGVLKSVKILNGYNLSGQMKRARNSDSKTHVKK